MALGSRSFGLGLVLLTCGVIMHCTGDGYQSDGGVQDGGIGDVNRDELQTMPDVFGSDSGDAGPGYSELCGVVTCVPDDPTSCSSGGAM
ncbi:MAG TPA: hypothetical protein VGP93_11325, partial [Polyangiaceae bacterium]|nr:hypothetical protein [Polyangiaceae bacterium]